MSLIIEPILCNAGAMDNYAYLVTDAQTNISAIIDASEASPIINFCKSKNITPSYILVTHHHFDHNGGNEELKKIFGLKIVGAETEKDKIAGNVDICLNNNDFFDLGKSKVQVFEAKGHTNGHLLWYFANDKVLFTGDTLFNLCIGGLFEGTPQEMWRSLQIIKKFPDDVKFYPGHEYTRSGIGCLIQNQSQPECEEYLHFIEQKIKNNLPIVGVPLGLEKKCNPYLHIDNENDFYNNF